MGYGTGIRGVTHAGEDVAVAVNKLSDERAVQLVDTNPWFAGVATAGDATTLTDTSKDFGVDMLIGDIITFKIGTKQFVRLITDNDATVITFATLGGTVEAAAGLEYSIVIL